MTIWSEIAPKATLAVRAVTRPTHFAIGFAASGDGSVVVGESFAFGTRAMEIERGFVWSAGASTQYVGGRDAVDEPTWWLVRLGDDVLVAPL